MSPKLDPSLNHFLAGLPDAELKSLAPHLELVSLKLGDVLHWHGTPAAYVFFPLNATVSLITNVEEGRGVEVALIGPDGLVGIWAALGAKENWHQAVVQVPGPCLRIKVGAFRAQLDRSKVLLAQLHLYIRQILAQISQTAACNRLHRLDQRFARWLLMTHDLAQAIEFPMTHEFLSHMLGAERSDVTIAAGLLRKSGVINYSRGKIKVLDRTALEAAACECYQILFDGLIHLHQENKPNSNFLPSIRKGRL